MYSLLGNTGFRLLSIKPGVHDEQIECALTVVESIDDAPDFEALSYLWGQEMSPNPIFCNGVEKTVTRNLEEALKGLRKPPSWDAVPTWPKTHPLHSERHAWRSFARNRHEEQGEDSKGDAASLLQMPVWADALCINQEDAKERTQQVKLMGRIYRQARTVKIWLGDKSRPRPRPPKADPVHYHLAELGGTPVVLSFLAQALRNPQDGENSLLALRPAEDRLHRNHVHGLLAPAAEEWTVLRDFFANPYFRRVWIVQEVAVAGRAEAIVGDWHLDWAAIGRAASWFARNGYALPRASRLGLTKQPSSNDLVPVGEAAALWDIHRAPDRRTPLLTLLKEFRMRQAGQDVDRLYATLGIAEETAGLGRSGEGGLHSLLEPDYEKPLLDVYRDATRYLIVKHGSLRVLCHVDNGPTKTVPDWPSWVPDWRQAKVSSEIWNAEETGARLAAAGDEPVVFGTVSHESRLSLGGREVDRVRSYGLKLESYGVGHVTYMQEREFVQAAWKLAMRAAQGASGGEEGPRSKPDLLATFVEVLTAGAKATSSMGDALGWLAKHLEDGALTNRIRNLPRWDQKGDAGRFHEVFVRFCTGRRFFVTDKGRIGIGPEPMAEGDRVVVLFGSRVPFVLRDVGLRFKLVGECYVAGLMEGQAIAEGGNSREGDAEFELA
ncbi:uncharacterized protein PG998_003018 [Apiospora kogelbergensis]|uniref:uncharacterized protein n=1 Tax=Apiospora kogelbergensis TaxID=1337665 RepID=UPI003131BF50